MNDVHWIIIFGAFQGIAAMVLIMAHLIIHDLKDSESKTHYNQNLGGSNPKEVDNDSGKQEH